MSRRRTPTQEAKGIIAAQARAYLDAGQPQEDCGCDPTCRRCAAIRRAIEREADRLEATIEIVIEVGR